jgi:hypothetical protein
MMVIHGLKEGVRLSAEAREWWSVVGYACWS